MNDELEIRLRNAFRGGSLPAAPGRLFDHLQEVANGPVVGAPGLDGGARGARRPWNALAVAAVLLIGGAVAVSIGSRGPSPLPNVAPTTVPVKPTPGGPIRLVYEPRPTEVAFVDLLPTTVEVVQQRIDATGLIDARVSTDEQDRIVIDLPALNDPDSIRQLIGQVGQVAFIPLAGRTIERGEKLDRALFPAPIIDSSNISSALVANDGTGQPALQILLIGEAGITFGNYTASNVGSQFAIDLDGTALAVPTINEAIRDGIVEISFPPAEIDRIELGRLATIIRFGPLPVALVEVTSGVAPSASAIAGDPPIRCGPRVDVAGLQLECQPAVRAAVASLPAGHPEIKEITFQHGCPEIPGKEIDCATQMFGIVVINFKDATPEVRILVDYDLKISYLPGSAAPDPSAEPLQPAG